MTSKTFPTHTALSAALMMGAGPIKFSDIHEIVEHVMGHPVWTHELGEFLPKASAKLRPLFPGLPTTADLEAMPLDERQQALEILLLKSVNMHGQTMDIEEGTDVRSENPLQSAARVFGPDKEVIAVSA